PLVVLRSIHAGHVKLLMGVAAWAGAFLGFESGIKVVLWTVLLGLVIGSILALSLLLIRKDLRRKMMLSLYGIACAVPLNMDKSTPTDPSKAARQRLMPACIPFGLGALAYFFWFRNQ